MSRIVENQIPFFKNYIKKHENADFTTADIEYIYRYVHEKKMKVLQYLTLYVMH